MRVISRVSELIKLRDGGEPKVPDLAAFLQAPNIEDWASLFDGRQTSSGSLPPNIQHVVKGLNSDATPLVLVHPISGVAGNWYKSVSVVLIVYYFVLCFVV